MVTTTHDAITGDARDLSFLESESVALVVTSPPYPMIEMWDDVFSSASARVADALSAEDAPAAFEAMHEVLDDAWLEVSRVLIPGGFACINIGDAVRTIGGRFRLHANHARILRSFEGMDFDVLPGVLWRKPTNAPNKFMGSGMLPAGAYVTLEHEHVLVLRKGGKRVVTREEEKARRRASAYFWEERNRWFSDLWEIRGREQHLPSPEAGARERTAAFPFEIPYRLVNMYSVQGDVVLDPFAGTGTTSLAALASARSSVAVDLEESYVRGIPSALLAAGPLVDHVVRARLEAHAEFVKERAESKEILHENAVHGFPVVTRQERELALLRVARMEVEEPHRALERKTRAPSPRHLSRLRAFHAISSWPGETDGSISRPPRGVARGALRDRSEAPLSAWESTPPS